MDAKQTYSPLSRSVLIKLVISEFANEIEVILLYLGVFSSNKKFHGDNVEFI